MLTSLKLVIVSKSSRNIQIGKKDLVGKHSFTEYVHWKAWKYDALLGCNQTSFETLFNYTWKHVHKICAGYVQLKAFFPFLKTLYFASWGSRSLKELISQWSSNDP